MLEEPALDQVALRESLRNEYAIGAVRSEFVAGYDPRSAAYSVTTAEGQRFFLKVLFDAVDTTSLEVPAALLDAGVPNVLAALPTRTSRLWAECEDHRLVVYPWVAASNAMHAGLNEQQWRSFGSTLRAVHDSGLQNRFADILPTDTFALAAGAKVTAMLELAGIGTFTTASARRHAEFLRGQDGRIGSMLARAVELGATLRLRDFVRVLCHADIHAANILVADATGAVYLVDWDGPMIAPRERDLLFVIGSRIARDVQPHEEKWFFEGYGEMAIEAEAIIYYRYERILEDIGEFAASIFLDDSLTEATRESEADLVAAIFGPGGMIETVENV